jgi:hypothetical protein
MDMTAPLLEFARERQAQDITPMVAKYSPARMAVIFTNGDCNYRQLWRILPPHFKGRGSSHECRRQAPDF